MLVTGKAKEQTLIADLLLYYGGFLNAEEKRQVLLNYREAIDNPEAGIPAFPQAG